MTTTITHPGIEQFAKDVRTALRDLGATEVAELTEGLEADLVAQANEQGDSFTLPNAHEYAAELRDAAGLPTVSRGVFGCVDRIARRMAEGIARNRIVSPVARYLANFAPVWWLVRGYLAFYVVHLVILSNHAVALPTTWGDWLLLGAFMFISAQLGRRQWKLNRFLWRTVAVLNVFAVLVAPAILGSVGSIVAQSYQLYQDGAVVPQVETGLRLHSQQIDNIFVYDENGKPLSNVQLFTQSGDPITVKFNEGPFPQVVLNTTEEFLDYIYVENTRAIRGNGWNVFPLPMVPTSDAGKVEAGEDMSWDAVPAPLPYPTVPALKKVEPKR